MMMMMFSSFMLGLVTFALSGGGGADDSDATQADADAAQAKADAVAADPNATPEEIAAAQVEADAVAAGDTNSGPTPATPQERNLAAQEAAAAADATYLETIRTSANEKDRAAAAAAKAQADADAAAAALAADPAADPAEVAAAEEKVTTAKTYAELGCERCEQLMRCPSNECNGCYQRNAGRTGCPQSW
jgi:colicin import membrane protein